MIFFQPIILAAEFVTHVVLIVLMGIMVVEYVVERKCFDTHALKRRAFYAVIAMTVFGALWVFIDYFGLFDIPPLGFLRYALLLGIIALVGYLMWMIRHAPGIVRIPKALGIALVMVILVFAGFDILYRATGMPSIGIFYALFRIIGVSVYYLFIMRYLIENHSYDNVYI